MTTQSPASLPQRLKAVMVTGSFGIDSIGIEERPMPAAPPRHVLVRVRAVSLNYRDYLVATGRYNPKMPLPRVLCSDGAGEVAAAGEGVTRVAVGDRVAGIFMQTWLAGPLTAEHGKSALGGAIDGMFAEYALLHEDGLVRIPDHLSFAEASTLPCAAVTAWNALVTEGAVKAGDTVLIQGTGGVSIFALQFALLHGAKVIATSGNNEKLQRALALGAAEGINYRETPAWDKRVLELTAGAGVDHVIEVGGTGTLAKSFNAVRVSGRVSAIGVLTGITGEVPFAPVLHKRLTVQGIYVGSREVFEEMNRAIAQHQVRPQIDRVYRMSEAREAFRLMEAGAHFGKIVISVD